MSNAKKRSDGAFDLGRAKSEARGEPFPIVLDVDTTLEIPRPSAGTMFEVEAATSSREILELLCGKHAKQVLTELDDADFQVAEELATAMQKHFGMGESRASRG